MFTQRVMGGREREIQRTFALVVSGNVVALCRYVGGSHRGRSVATVCSDRRLLYGMDAATAIYARGPVAINS